MSKADKFYFENFLEAADLSCRAAAYLRDCLTDFHPENMTDMLQKMHAIEHECDGKKHEMSSALARAFVTPVDREDLALISQNIDDVTDRIEEVLQRFYVDDLVAVTPDAVAFVNHIVTCCELMRDILAEFPNFKKPAKLHDKIVELNGIEEECDRLYLEATHRLRTEMTDVLDIISWREIYRRLEDCADACEHVGDCIETVVMKNT